MELKEEDVVDVSSDSSDSTPPWTIQSGRKRRRRRRVEVRG